MQLQESERSIPNMSEHEIQVSKEKERISKVYPELSNEA